MKKRNTSLFDLADKRIEEEENTLGSRVSEQKSDLLNPTGPVVYKRYKNSGTDLFDKADSYLANVRNQEKAESDYRASLPSDADREAYDRVKASNGVYHSPYLADTTEGKEKLTFDNDDWNKLSESEKRKWLDIAEGNDRAKRYFGDVNGLDQWKLDYAKQIVNDPKDHSITNATANAANTFLGFLGKKQNVDTYNTQTFDKDREQAWMFRSLPQEIRDDLVGTVHSPSTKKYLEENYSPEEVEMFYKYGQLLGDTEEVQETRNKLEEKLSSDPFYATVVAPFQQNVSDLAQFLDAPNTMLNVANNSNAYGVVNNYQTDLQKHLAYGQYIQGSINEGLSENTLARFLYNTNMSALESTERMVLSRALAGTVTSIAPSVPYNIAAGMAMNGMMGLGVMRQEAVSLMEQGVPASKAIQTALMRGIFECAFETISLDKLGMFDEMPVVADVKTFAKNLLKAGFVEGSEEVATDLANELYDYFAAYDYSDYKQFADAYRAEHPRATDEEIWPLYNKKFAGQLVESFLGGAVSGIAMSSVQNATAWKNGQELGALGANVSDADASRMEYVVNALANAYPNVRENLQNAEEAGEVYRRGFLQKMVNSLSENYEKAIDKASNEKELNTVMENMNTNLNSVISEEAINKYNAKMVEFGKTGDINYQEFIQRRDSNPNTTFSDLAYGNGNSEISQKFREDESVINENLGNAFRGDEKAYNSIVEARNRILETRSNAEKMVENYAMLGKTLDSNEVRQFEGVLGGTERMARAFSVGKMAGEETVKTSNVGSIASMSQEEINREFGENAANIVDYNAIRGKKNYQLAYNVGKSLTNMGINVRLYESNRNKVIPNGFYKNGTIYLDINAGVSGANAAIGETFSHELTHWIRSQNEEGYQRLLDFVKNELGDDFEKQVKRELGKLNGKDNNVAEEEVVANACAKMLQNSETFKRYAIADMTGAKKILAYLREFIANLKKAFKGSLYEQATSLISDMEGLQKEWEKALNEAIAENGMEVKAAEGIIEGNTEVAENIIGTPVVTEESTKTSQRLNDELMDKAMKVAIKDGSKYGITIQMINRAIAQTKSVANRLNGDLKGFLPADNPGKVEVGNNSYGKSMENSLVCIRSIINQAYIAQVAEEVGRPLTVEEQIVASQVLQEVNSRPECNYCYVATDRQAYEAFFGSYFKQYADVYNKALAQKDELSDLVKNGEKQLESVEKDKGNALQKLYAEFLDGRSNTKPMRKRFMTWVDNAMRGNMRITEKDLASVNTRTSAKNDKAKAWMIADAESYSKSAAWPKLTNRKVKINGQNYILDYVSYNGSILKWKQDLVDKLNSEFGLRMYSFSDYVPAFLLENMQMIIDASLRGLKVLAYTKDCGFAETFADSGAGINISLFGTLDPNYKNDANLTKLREEYNANKNDKTRKAYLSALDKYVVKDGVNGKEGMMGANWDRATALRKSHNNVGTVFVATNDDLVEWALANPDIDVVIPYHLVRTGDAKAAIYGYKNYKASQEDKKTKSWTSGNLKSIPPTVHGNDLKTYRQALKDNNLTARFSEFADNPNYMKLVNETRMSYKELQPVKPIFDTALVNRELARIEAEGQYGLMQGFKTKEEQDAFLKSQNTVGKAVEKINGAKLSSRVSDEELEQIKAKKRTNAQDRIILRDAGEKLSEKDFYNLYSAHKLDLRGKGNVDEQVESIKNTGFRGDGGFGHNIVPASINNINRFTIDERKEYMRQFGRTEEEINEGIDRIRENGHGIWSGDTYFPEVNWTQRAYGGRKGDTVLLVPEHYTEGFSKNEDRVRVKNGFKPFDYEVVKVERDFQPYYELYSKAYDEAKARGDMGIRFSSRDSAGNALTPEQTEYFKDSKVRDAEGNLKVLYHGTEADFNIFDFSQGGKNGTAEGYGIYLTDNELVAKAYGGRIIKSYANITKPARFDQKTITPSKLAKLIETTAKNQAQSMIEEEGYGNLNDAIKDTWISNYTYTYDKPLASSYREVANSIIRMSDNDRDIIQEVMSGMAIRDYDAAVKFYDVLGDVLGIDGFITEWKNRETGEKSEIVLAFRSNQVKNTDNLNPSESDDIRYSTRDSEYMQAVESGDMETAQKMVDASAKANGYTKKVYHGTRGERFNIFDFSKDQRGNDQMFFSSNRKVSETYGKNVMSLYIDTHNFLTVDANGDWWGGFDDKITKDKAQAVLDETRRVLYEKLQDAEAKTWEYKYGTEEYKKAFKEYEDAYSDWEDIRQKLTPYDDEYIYGTTYSVAKKAKEMGYDGLIIKRVIDTADENVTIPSTVYVIYDANRVKSADAVTYDNNGNIIPLSERFNKEEDDIRYAIRDIANSESEMLVNALKTDTALADDKTSRYSLELYAKEYNNLKAMENESIKLAKSLKKASPSEREVITKKILRLDRQILKATEKLTEMRTQRVLTDVLVSEWEKRLADVEWTNELTFQKTKKALEDRYGRAITGLKMKSKEQKQEIRDRYEINKRKKNIEKKTKEIMNRILHPTEKKHIPSILINPIVEMLDSIDNWTPAENRRVTKKSESMRERFINFREAVNRYQKEIDEGAELTEYMFDPEFLETVDELCESVKGIDNVNDMSVEDIVKLDQTLTELNHLIARGNKMITASHYATINDAVSETYNELSKREDVRKAKGNLYQRLNAGMSDSYAFGQYGGAGAANIIDMLSKAFEKKILQVRQGKEFAENLLKGKDTKSWSKDKIAFRTEGGQTIELTVAQMMELYLLNNREQARGHIYGGGINIEDKKGKFRKAVKVTEEDVNNIIRYLRNVPGAIEVADALQNFGATTVTGWGNEASNLLYGISKFTDPNYWQIRSDSASLKDNANSEAQANASMFKLQNLGRTKAVKKNANNAIYIGDVFDTYAKTIDEMSSYGSILPATTDAMRWYNSSVAVDEDTRIRVKALLQNKLGTDMARVFTDTIRALNGGILGTDSLESLVKVMTGRAKAAAVAGNLRVVLQQPTAYTRAFSVIPAKYLLRALTMKPASAEAQEKSPIAWHKAQGFYSNGLAPSLRKLIVGDQTVGESITEKALWLAGKADDITWGALWNASKLMVNDTTNLQKGSDEYWKKVNEVFSDIINKTQVVDTPLTKSTWMRGNGVGIYFTAFMAEPTKTYSMVSTAIDRVLQHPHSAEAKKALAIAGFTFGLNAIVNAFAQAIADAARDDDKEKDYFEKFREQWQEDVVDNLNPLTYVPVVKDAWSAINGYSSSRLDLQAIQNSVYAMNELKKIASGKSTKTLFGQVEQVSKAVSSWTGIPVSNVMRTMNSFGNLMGIDAFRRKKYTNTELARNIALSVDAGNAEDVEKYTKELSENLARSNSSRSVDDYVSDYLADHSEKIDEWAERYYDDPTTLNDAIADMSEWYSPDVVVSAIKKSINHDAGDDKSQKVSTSTAAGTIYNGGDINRMLKKGDIATAQEIIDTMQDGYAEMGSSASPKTQITSYWKPIYQSASLQEKEDIRKMLYKLNWKGKQMYSAKDFEKWK